MKFNKITIALSLSALVISILSAYKYAGAPKIGIVDNAVLINQFSVAIEGRQKLEREKESWEKDMKSLEDSIDAAMEDLKANYEKSSQEDRRKMQSRLQHWNKEYTKFNKAIQKKSAESEAQMMASVFDKVNTFIGNWGNQNGFDVIYGTGAGGVILMRQPHYDVTARVLKDINDLYKPSSQSVSENRANSELETIPEKNNK